MEGFLFKVRPQLGVCSKLRFENVDNDGSRFLRLLDDDDDTLTTQDTIY